MKSHFLKKVNKQGGQSLFEFIVFLPFLVFLYTIFYTAGNAISGSINQQKATRAYFYYLLKGNSYLHVPSDLLKLKSENINRIGFFAIGWREKESSGKQSFAPCFQFSSLLKNNSTEECDAPNFEEERSTRLIRIYTTYGVCGPMYLPAERMGNIKDAGIAKFYIPQEAQSGNKVCELAD